MKSGSTQPIRDRLQKIYGEAGMIKSLDDKAVVELGENLRAVFPSQRPSSTARAKRTLSKCCRRAASILGTGHAV